MLEWPWTKARKRREVEQAAAEHAAKLQREEKERRAAKVLADQIHRSRIAAMHRPQTVPARPATVTPIKATGYGLTAQRAAQEDQRKRDEEEARKRRQTSDSTSSNDYGLYQAQASFASSVPEPSNEVSHKMAGGGGTFDGGGASGDWSSGSSSSDSGSSGGGDSGGGGCGGSD